MAMISSSENDDPVVDDAIQEFSSGRVSHVDLCSLCNCQLSACEDCSDPANNQRIRHLKNSYSLTEQNKVEDVVRVFLADSEERNLHLQLCISCKDHCKRLLEAQREVSLMIDHITTLLLQNSRFTLVHPKHILILDIFFNPKFQWTENNQQHIPSSLSSEILEPVPAGVDTDIERLNHLKKTTTEDISLLDREIAELETQFHLDRLRNGKMHGREVDENEDSDKDSSTSSLYSSFRSLLSFDSLFSSQKDAAGNSIMNVQISALESSASDCNQDQSPAKETKPKLASIISKPNSHLSIVNLIANTTNDDLEVCFSNKIQHLKTHKSGEVNLATKVEPVVAPEVPTSEDRSFRLPATTTKISPNIPTTSNKSNHPFPTTTQPQKSKTKKPKKLTPKTEDRNIKRKFTCTVCQKKWKTKKDLNTHMDSHLKISKFICSICCVAYRHKSGLESHMNTVHSGNAKFKCAQCQKQFTQKAGLERHIEAIHMNARNYKCDQCGKAFRYHSSFNVHKQSHKDKPKKFPCEFPSCDRSFYTSYHLRRHAKVHTGCKPYSCTTCQKSFAEKYNLETHLRHYEHVQNNDRIKPEPL